MILDMIYPPLTLLLIEDDFDEAELFASALTHIAEDILLVHAPDESTALAWLEERRHHLPPMVILLDLDLGGQDGHVLLEQLKTDPEFRCLPVVMLTNSQHPGDVERAYRGYASGYLVKPVSVDEYNALLSVLTGYWRRAVRLPT